MMDEHAREPISPDLARYRAIFISDVHLGTRNSQTRQLLAFLRSVEADTVYLVGDIIDGWRLKKSWYWPQEHNDVVQKLLRKVRKGTRLIYIPGNHDEFLRDYLGTHFGGVEVVDTIIHEAIDGRRFLVIHGDVFDVVVHHARWLALLGDWAYELALAINARVNRVRRRLGLTYWSLSQAAKLKVKDAVKVISRYEDALVAQARQDRVDGVICGHIHHAAIHEQLGIAYINCGDWVESCTAVAETYDGHFQIIRWSESHSAPRTQDDIRAPVPANAHSAGATYLASTGERGCLLADRTRSVDKR